MNQIAVSISYCASHKKGPCYTIDPDEHGQMLFDTVEYVRSEVDWPIIICVVGSPCESTVKVPTIANCSIRSVDGHDEPCEGALYNIDMALRAAEANDCDLLVHTCEDVIPHRGVLQRMADNLIQYEQAIYTGEVWRDNGLSTQFFACRVQPMAEMFRVPDPAWLATPEKRFDWGPEDYMKWLVIDRARTRPIVVTERNYEHNHTYADFKRLLDIQLASGTERTS